jgi:hypothetical protein
MYVFRAGRWSGGQQLFWKALQPGNRLELEIDVHHDANYVVWAALTLARDYGVIQFHLDDEPLGYPLNLLSMSTEVIASGEIALDRRWLTAGAHRLTMEIKGTTSPWKGHFVGLDYLRLAPED